MKAKSLLFGLLSGAVLGVLFAPETGKKMREKFKEERKKGGTGFNSLKKSFVEMGSDIWETIEESSAAEKTAEKVEEASDFVKKKLHLKKSKKE